MSAPGGSVGWVDTTLREITAPPIGPGVSTEQLAAAATALAACGADYLEVLDPLAALRVLERWGESPWDRLRAVVRMVGSTPVGIYIAGRTLFGDRPVSDDLIRSLVLTAAANGVTRVRVFDPLNHAEALLPAAEAAKEAGIHFTPVLQVGASPDPSDDRWAAEASALAALPGAERICVADGGCYHSPTALAAMVTRVAAATGLPVEVAAVGTGALATPTAIACVAAGAETVYAAVGAAALVGGRPSVETLRAVLADAPRSLSVRRTELAAAAEVVGGCFSGEVLRQAASDANGPALGLAPRVAAGLTARLSRLGRSDCLVAAADEVAAVAIDCGALTVVHPFGEGIAAQACQHAIDGSRWTSIEPVLADAVRGEWGMLRGPVAPAVSAAVESAPAARHEGLMDLAGAVAAAPTGLSEEDVVLWAQFPEPAERLASRRRSIESEAWEGATPALDRDLLETLVSVLQDTGGVEVTVDIHGTRVTARPSGAVAALPAGGAAPVAADPHAGFAKIESPIVGTFYRAANPESAPFVEVGTKISVGQTVCIIEAMKIFNEINAERSGTIREILADNAEPVEFGQPLFLIDPS